MPVWPRLLAALETFFVPHETFGMYVGFQVLLHVCSGQDANRRPVTLPGHSCPALPTRSAVDAEGIRTTTAQNHKFKFSVWLNSWQQQVNHLQRA